MNVSHLTRGVLIWIALLASAGAHAESAWGDIESRIQYNYYTEDRRALQSLADALAGSSSPEPLRRYYAALVNYRIALLTLAGRQGEATDAADRCISNLDAMLKQRTDSADALALQAACFGILRTLKPLRAPLAGSKSSHQLDRALERAPKNPRVLLLDALGEYDRPLIYGSRERSLNKLKKAVEAFEIERLGVEPVPGWGAADAYTFLARSYLEKGDAIAARGALEHALLIAPEFALARRLLTRITSG